MKYVCTGATLQCTMGTSCPKLIATPKNVSLTGNDQANVADYVSMKNIPSFGLCRSLGYPPTASATAANLGRLTPMPCVPGTCPKWQVVDKDSLICGEPALLEPATLKCMYGGTISIVSPGQSLEIKANAPVRDELLENSIVDDNLPQDADRQKELTFNEIVDGIQLALDLAGFAPGVGAFPDIANAAIYALRGKWADAGLSIIAAVPLVGDAAAGIKIARKGVVRAARTKKLQTLKSAIKNRDASFFVDKNISRRQLEKNGMSTNEADLFLKNIRKKRRETASEFYKSHGEKDIESHINGIDLNKPVKIKKMPPPNELSRYDIPERDGNYIGSYFGVSKKTGSHINVPRNYGILPVVKTKDGKIVRKRKRVYGIDNDTPQFEYLETTASPLPAPLNDDWKSPKTDKANWKDTKGGAVQAYIPNQYKKYLKWIK